MNSNKKLLFITVGLSVLIFGGLVWAILSAPPANAPGATSGAVSFDDTNDPFIGPADAKVVVRLFGDLECPACRLAEPNVRYAIGTYSDRVKFIWDDFPLMSIHKNARPAANAARCAQDQGRFWDYKDMLYAQQSGWETLRDPKESFVAFARQLNMDEAQFTSCYDSGKFDDRVLADVAEGNKNAVDRTPTVFINQTRRFGMTTAEWDQMLTDALKAAETASSGS